MQSITINPTLLRSLLSLATFIEARDPYTGGHTWRVSRYARLLADKAGLPEDEAYITYLGGLVHDLGKVGVSDQVLNKRERLTDVELAIIRKHPAMGEMLVNDHPLAVILRDVVREHHERYNGQGYPRGLAGDGISLPARIVAIADSFDAMTSARCYQTPKTKLQAVEIVRREAGGQFDPALAALFADMAANGELDHVLGHSAEQALMKYCTECGPTIVLPPDAQNGATTFCPVCTGTYIIETQSGEFEVVWTGAYEPTLVPRPDVPTVEEALRLAPKKLKIPAKAN